MYSSRFLQKRFNSVCPHLRDHVTTMPSRFPPASECGGGLEEGSRKGAHFSSPAMTAASSDQLLQLLRKGMQSPLPPMATHIGGHTTILSEYQKTFGSTGGSTKGKPKELDVGFMGTRGVLRGGGSMLPTTPYHGSQPVHRSSLAPQSTASSERPRSITALAAEMVSFARPSSSSPWEKTSLRAAAASSHQFAPNWNRPVQPAPLSKGPDR